jgi:hypothetical protein
LAGTPLAKDSSAGKLLAGKPLAGSSSAGKLLAGESLAGTAGAPRGSRPPLPAPSSAPPSPPACDDEARAPDFALRFSARESSHAVHVHTAQAPAEPPLSAPPSPPVCDDEAHVTDAAPRSAAFESSDAVHVDTRESSDAIHVHTALEQPTAAQAPTITPAPAAAPPAPAAPPTDRPPPSPTPAPPVTATIGLTPPSPTPPPSAGALGWRPPPARPLGILPSHERAQTQLASCADCLLCRAAACLARTANHPHAPPFCSPVDLLLFPDYLSRVGPSIDLRSIAEALALGAYGFGDDGDDPAAAAALASDVRRVWANARAYAGARSVVARLISALETEFESAWAEWVEKRKEGWLPLLQRAVGRLVRLPKGGRLPKQAAAGAPLRPLPSKPQRYAQPPPPVCSQEQLRKLTVAERQRMLEESLPNRAPPPPGWSADDVGGVPWHKQRAFETVPARAAVARGEEAMRRLLQDEAETEMASGPSNSETGRLGRVGKVVAAAVGKRVVCRGRTSGGEARGVYQHNGRIRDDASRIAMKPADFAVAAGNKVRMCGSLASPPQYTQCPPPV